MRGCVGGWVVRMLVDDTLQRCNAMTRPDDTMQRGEAVLADDTMTARNWILIRGLFRTRGFLTTKEMVIQIQVRIRSLRGLTPCVRTYVRIPPG